MTRPVTTTCSDCPAILTVRPKGPVPKVCRPCRRARVRVAWRAKKDLQPQCAGITEDGSQCSSGGRFESPAGLVCGRHKRWDAVLRFPARVQPPVPRCPTCGR